MIILALLTGFFVGAATLGSVLYFRGWRLPGDLAAAEFDAYKAGFSDGRSRSGWSE